jgi:hypothetical protein
VIVGLSTSSEIATDDVSVTYNVYLQLGVDGLRGLVNFNVNDQVRLFASPKSEVARLMNSAEMGAGA